MSRCEHIGKIENEPIPNTPDGCGECLETGDEWVHLRLCLICGNVGCCDNSKNQHASKHFHKTGHPLIKSFEPGEKWKWCYIDKVFLK
jgi:monovalent cation/hydrogen antiporter